MLPRFLRLGRAGFGQMRGLSRTSTPHFSISYSTSPAAGGTAVIVPKKVIKGAVQRHLLKRRLRAILRPWSSADRTLIVSARNGAGDLPYPEVESELSTALSAILGEHA
jgi:ribonuclease P protein component